LHLQIGVATTTNTAQDDGRFNVVIHCFCNDESSVEFKTRGKYLVRKVLASACKTFEVDYDRSVYPPIHSSSWSRTLCVAIDFFHRPYRSNGRIAVLTFFPVRLSCLRTVRDWSWSSRKTMERKICISVTPTRRWRCVECYLIRGSCSKWRANILMRIVKRRTKIERVWFVLFLGLY